MDAYLLHAINHINASAARIKKNNDALQAGQDTEACRDQGFTRAKVRCTCCSVLWCPLMCAPSCLSFHLCNCHTGIMQALGWLQYHGMLRQLCGR